MSKRPYIVVEVKKDEADAFDELVSGLHGLFLRRAANPLDRLLIRIAEAEGSQRNPYGRCPECKGRGWVEEDE